MKIGMKFLQSLDIQSTETEVRYGQTPKTYRSNTKAEVRYDWMSRECELEQTNSHRNSRKFQADSARGLSKQDIFGGGEVPDPNTTWWPGSPETGEMKVRLISF